MASVTVAGLRVPPPQLDMYPCQIPRKMAPESESRPSNPEHNQRLAMQHPPTGRGCTTAALQTSRAREVILPGNQQPQSIVKGRTTNPITVPATAGGTPVIPIRLEHR